MTGLFSCGAHNKKDLIKETEKGYGKKWKMDVVDTITLSHDDYEYFCEGFEDHYDFLQYLPYDCRIKWNGRETYAQCILVRDESKKGEAIAVVTENSSTAKYIALIKF